MYFASLGEVLLVISLLAFARTMIFVEVPEGAKPWFKGINVIALLFIAVTASIGVFRFAGAESVVGVHDATSFWSKHVAMVLYACGLPLLFSRQKNALLVATLGILVAITLAFFSHFWFVQLPAIIIDVIIFVGLLLFGLSVVEHNQVWLALGVLLLVPLTALLGLSDDLHMGLFHLLLAIHFYLISRVVKLQNTSKLIS